MFTSRYGSPIFSSLVVALVAVGDARSADFCGREKTLVSEININERREFTVCDAIEMTIVSKTPTFQRDRLIRTSPDRQVTIVVVQRGNLTAMTNDFEIWLYRIPELREYIDDPTGTSPPTRRVLASFSSTSNRPAIAEIQWPMLSGMLDILGEQPGGYPQIFRLDLKSGAMSQLTNEPEGVLGFSTVGSQHVYITIREDTNIRSPRISIHDQQIDEILFPGKFSDPSRLASIYQTVVRTESGERKVIDERWMNPFGRYQRYWPSPDGRYAIALLPPREVQSRWERLDYRHLAYSVSSAASTPPIWLRQFYLIDTKTFEVTPLTSMPAATRIGVSPAALWAGDSKSVILLGTYMPPSSIILDRDRRELELDGAVIAEVEIPERSVTKIADLPPAPYSQGGKSDDLSGNRTAREIWTAVRWGDSHSVLLVDRRSATADMSPLSFFKERGQWSPRKSRTMTRPAVIAIPRIELAQRFDERPRLMVSSPDDHAQFPLVDLNPIFDHLSLGSVSEIEWYDGNDRAWRGGIVLPPDYEEGRRYPLVIQTHGFDRKRFLVEGASSTGYAAQALANEQFVVLQMEDHPDTWSTPQEGAEHMMGYESAIKYLARRGLVDRDRVGLLGFSRTSFHVKYAIAHSAHHFGAASTADGFDYGYMNYLLFYNFHGGSTRREIESMNGGSPFGPQLQKWVNRSIGFNAQNIRTPLRIQAIGPVSLLQEWEVFSALRVLNKRVSMNYLPEGTHHLVKPDERFVASQGNVAWFNFWLRGVGDLYANKQ